MWPFRRTKRAGELPVLPFKNGKALFEYQCKYGDTELLPKKGIVGLVKIASTDDDTGVQSATLEIASSDGGFEVFSQTLGRKGDKLEVDDIVIWVPLRKDPLLAQANKRGDVGSSWMGMIVAKVAAEIDPNADQFRIISKYSE